MLSWTVSGHSRSSVGLRPRRCCVNRGKNGKVFLSELSPVQLDGVLKPEVDGVTDQCMTDAHFIQPRDVLFEKFQVVKIEVMSCIQSDTGFLCFFCCRDVRDHSAIAFSLCI